MIMIFRRVSYSHRQKSYLVDGAPRPAALIGLAYSRMCMFVMAFSDWTVQGEPIVWNERSSTTCEATAREQQANRGEPLKIWRTKVSPALGLFPGKGYFRSRHSLGDKRSSGHLAIVMTFADVTEVPYVVPLWKTSCSKSRV
jgi:hypothetical protein